MQPQHELLEIVLALHARRGLTHTTGRRQQKTNQDRNDPDDDEKFEQGESAAC
jgi:hypothetical protein